MTRAVSVGAESSPAIKNRINPLAIFLAHKICALLTWLLVVLLGLAATIYFPASYESSIAIHVNRAKVATISDAENNASQTRIGEEEFKAEAEALLSQPVIEAVVKELNLTAHTQETLDQAIADLRGKLKVTSHQSDQTFVVTYVDRSVERGNQILCALFQSYEAHQRLLKKASESRQSLPEAIAALNLTPTELQAKLSQIKVAENADEKTVKRAILLRQYYQTLSQLNMTRAELFEIEQRFFVFHGVLVKPPAQTEEPYAHTGSISSPIRDEVVRVPEENKVISRDQIPNQRLMDDLQALQTKQTELTERQKNLLDAMTQIQTMLQSLDQQGIENSSPSDREAGNFDLKKQRETEVLTAASRQVAVNMSAVNISMDRRPTTRRHPINPPTLIAVVLCVVLGLIASCLSVYLAEYFKARVKQTMPATQGRKTPVLAHIPEL